MRLLLVEDNDGIILALHRALRPVYTIEATGSVSGAISKINKNSYECIILDLNLPDGSGLKVCEHLRSEGLTTPILVLSGNDDTKTIVTLLDSGANDYIIKPFKVDELLARLRMLIRQAIEPSQRHHIVVSDLVLDRVKKQVSRGGQLIKLRRKEYALLECLMQNNGVAVSRATLGLSAWEEDYDISTNTVDVHIKYLRDKVDRPFVAPLIKTVHGLGYKIDASKV